MEARKNISPEFVFGEGALSLVGRYATNLGATKVLLVSDPGVMGAGWVEPVMRSLSEHGIPSCVFAEVTPNPRDTEVMRGAKCFQTEHCDVIVAVGGGSPMDCAKGIGIVTSNGRNILEFEGVDRIPIPGPPLICIPTTAGTSADVSQFDIVNDTARKVKIAIVSKAAIPDVALVDPVTTTTMPAQLTAATGIDALVHAIEAYVSRASSPITDLHALEAIRLIAKHLPGVLEEPLNLQHREQMALGSLLAGLAFSNASLGMVHAMAHALGGWMDLPHGECNALLLSHVVQFNFVSAPERYRLIGSAFGLSLDGLSNVNARDVLVESLYAFRHLAGLDRSLHDYGVSKRDLHILSKHALSDPCMATNPIHPTLTEIEHVYEQAIST